jgi:hypothetical protein
MGSTETPRTAVGDDALYFFPEERLSRSELEVILQGDDLERKAWAISHLLRYAVWDDIWRWTTREEVRELLPQLDLPPNLKGSLARMLKADAGVLAR